MSDNEGLTFNYLLDGETRFSLGINLPLSEVDTITQVALMRRYILTVFSIMRNIATINSEGDKDDWFERMMNHEGDDL